MARGQLRIGTSGYHYEHWRGIFYPPDLPKKDRFAHYARHFDTVEINNTFYRLPEEKTFLHWRELAPAGFVYALKFSRFGTHLKRLKDPEGPIDLFLQRARVLEGHLGVILVQLPPRFSFDLKRLEAFLRAAPADRRWALEFRDPSWLRDETFELLAEHDSALVVHDRIPDHPRRVTASWYYQRFHGGEGGTYSRQALAAEARRISAILESGHDAWIYFNNDVGGHAIQDARDLRRYIQRRLRRMRSPVRAGASAQR